MQPRLPILSYTHMRLDHPVRFHPPVRSGRARADRRRLRADLDLTSGSVSEHRKVGRMASLLQPASNLHLRAFRHLDAAAASER
jgi:hypothetical protein